MPVSRGKLTYSPRLRGSLSGSCPLKPSGYPGCCAVLHRQRVELQRLGGVYLVQGLITAGPQPAWSCVFWLVLGLVLVR